MRHRRGQCHHIQPASILQKQQSSCDIGWTWQADLISMPFVDDEEGMQVALSQ
jgi:hypothetical protein